MGINAQAASMLRQQAANSMADGNIYKGLSEPQSGLANQK
jgi:hypothetical protein